MYELLHHAETFIHSSELYVLLLNRTRDSVVFEIN